MTQLRNINVAARDSASIDAFSRWRVSSNNSLFDSKQIFNNPDQADSAENDPLFWDNSETSGAGTSTSYRPNESCQRITVGASTAGTRTRQTKQWFDYQTGKSQLVFLTYNFVSLDSGITKRVGYFNDNDGIFLEADGSTINIVRRTSISGSAVNNKVAQASWNIDAMDGTGPSGVTLDHTKAQILIIDFQWLGVGRIRVGFDVDGVVYYVHQFLNANNLTTVYMQTPNLPVRYEITNDGSGVASNLDTICQTVVSEGGEENIGILRYASTSTLVDASAAGTVYAVIGIRLKSDYIGKTVRVVSAKLLEIQGTKDLEWILMLNPTVAGSFTYADETNSAVQVARGATENEVTGGTYLNGGFFQSDRNVSEAIDQDLTNRLALGSTIAGDRDEIVLCVKPLAVTNSDVYGSLVWNEI